MPTRPAGLATLFALCLAALAAAQGVPPAPRPGPPSPQDPQGQPGVRPPASAAGAAGQPAFTLSAKWRTELPAPPAGAPAFDARYAFVPLRGDRITAVALDRGTVAWTSPGAARVVAAGGDLVFLADGERVEARTAATGERTWSFSTGEPLAPVLIWEGGWLLAATAAGDALMLSAADGRLLWRQAVGAGVAPHAAITGDRVYLLLEDGRVTARHLTDGSVIWEQRLGGRPTTLRALDDRLFVGAADKFLYCLDTSDGDRHWRWRTGGEVTGTPAVDAGRLYFVALDNVLRAVNRGNGNLRWMRPLGFRPSGGPVLLGDLLLVPMISPELAVFKAETGAPAGKVSAGAEPVAPPHVLPAAAEGGQVALVAVSRVGTVERLGLEPPALAGKPLPGGPQYLQLPIAEGQMPADEGESTLVPFTFFVVPFIFP